MTTVQEHDVDIQQSWQQSWQAVQTRDRRFDGRFVYAVKSTGVYCNPSCPSRRPQPEQVRFFTGPRRGPIGGVSRLPPLPAGPSGKGIGPERLGATGLQLY